MSIRGIKLLLSAMLLTANIVYADVKYDNSGSLDYSLTHMDNKYINTVDFIINNDVYLENTKFTFSPGIFTNDRSTYNSIIKGDVPRVNEIYINELYVSQKLTDELSIAIGVFPFRKGTFYEYGFNGYRAGNGLYSVTDVVLQGAILSYTIDEHTLQYGNLKYERWFSSYKDFEKSDSSITYDSYRDSGMNYVAYKYKSLPWYYEIQYADVSQKIEEIEIIRSNVYSLAVSYDTSSENGRTFYSILSYSHSRGDTSPLFATNGMYQGPPLDPNIPPAPTPGPALGPGAFRYIDNGYYYDRFETHGYYYLLGVKQELDHCLFDKDVVLSAEYAYRSPGYHNLLAGRPLSPHSYADIGHFYNLSAGIRVDKNNMIKLRYLLYDTENTSTKYGFSPVTTNSNNVPGSRDHYQLVILQWYYDF